MAHRIVAQYLVKENDEWVRKLTIYDTEEFNSKTKDELTKRIVKQYPGKEIRLYYLRDMESDTIKIIKENVTNEKRLELLHKKVVTRPSDERISD